MALTSWVDTARHAALVKSAARPLSNGQKLSPDFILACGFAATWTVVTVAMFLVVAVAASRRSRRMTWQADVIGADRRGRRASAGGWQS